MDPLYWNSLMDDKARAFIIKGVDKPINGKVTGIDKFNDLLIIECSVTFDHILNKPWVYTYTVPTRNIMAWSIRND